MADWRKKRERKEALMRIVVLIISGIILIVWKSLIVVLVVLQFLIALIAGKRIKSIALFSEIWNTQIYIFFRYMTFVTNKRPFPFASLEPQMSKFEK
ncbi:MAG: DUF4389 domain-containing protein [Nanoarchaeota archaeon]|nr:DUF4389 domain-containing protein [Nanoarchaeota archaeon]